MQAQGYGKTDLGRLRDNNEDSFFVSNTAVGLLPNLYIVADGIGGSQAGEVASDRAIHYFRERAEESGIGDACALLKDALQYANDKVYAMSAGKPEYEDMGTTFIGLTVQDGKASFCHIGDSRMYLYRDGKLLALTEDHTVSNHMRKNGLIGPDESYYRGDAIVKWIGVNGAIEPDTGTVELSDGAHILICSDGLSNMMSEDDIAMTIKQSSSAEEAVRALIDGANQNGGRDNITVILV